MRKKVDPRVRVLVENAVKTNHRAMLVIVGDRGRDQVVNMHYMLSKITTKKPSVLWCYKKDLGFSSHKKKRMKQLKKKQRRGGYDPNTEDPFELFVTSTKIRYCYYKDSHLILGQTFGMCVLQDFEALTPNILCRTIETCQGGGLVVVLLKTMSSLRQLYSLSLDAHTKLRTATHKDVEPRFNERFILSLSNSPSCLVLDDELNILPLSHHAKSIRPVSMDREDAGEELEGTDGVFETPTGKQLRELKVSMKDSPPVGLILQKCVTLDQARSVMSFAEAISEKTLRQTVALTAGRGRGKSAALGLAIASAIGFGYSNIFVTAPSPENVGTVFEFVQKGLEALGMNEHQDFELVAGASSDPNQTGEGGQGGSGASSSSSSSGQMGGETTSDRNLVRINVFRDHRQTVQYIAPQDHPYLAQAELLVIDEAAAIPLPLVRRLMGPYVVLMSSTVNGYEGTGRALSLKLVKDLRQAAARVRPKGIGEEGYSAKMQGRSFKEIELQEPIRYGPGDPVELWLHQLLCLDATTPAALSTDAEREGGGGGGGKLPPPHKCRLFMVDRDALFSFHKTSERFLSRLMSLFVSSHYKNTPNDLLLLSDAPAHMIFVLLPPVDEETAALPDVLVAIQVCVEGQLTKDSIRAALGRGLRPSGDLLPWTLSQHFVEEDFGSLTGLRVVRIATHPSLQRMGYGAAALKQLLSFFGMEKGVSLSSLAAADENGEKKGTAKQDEEEDEDDDEDMESEKKEEEEAEEDEDEVEEDKEDKAAKAARKKLQKEDLTPRKCPPLLVPCDESDPPYSPIDYVGTSFGLTQELFNFWRRAGFVPVYLRQTPSEVTGEYSAIMLKSLSEREREGGWLKGFVSDFRSRLLGLLGSVFHSLPCRLALSLVEPPSGGASSSSSSARKDDTSMETAQDGGEEGETAAGGGEAVDDPHALPPLTASSLKFFLTDHDLLRLKKYAQNMAERSLVLDLLPVLASLFFNRRLSGVSLSFVQTAVLLGIGCQRRSLEDISKELGVPVHQLLALFNRSMVRLHTHLRKLQETSVRRDLQREREKAEALSGLPPSSAAAASASLGGAALPTSSFAQELAEGAAEVEGKLAEQRRQLMDSLSKSKEAQRYNVGDLTDADLAAAMKGRKRLGGPGGGESFSVSIKRKPQQEASAETGGFDPSDPRMKKSQRQGKEGGGGKGGKKTSKFQQQKSKSKR
uniref:RNA cytidine acetyltransferase n=1 Tax=Chromera velia CCMP2878 TaxID=1169474 RepID=A0A0G4FX21_9ALVE|eukprot:Cvel_19163.t1-p1 / transcript=Cvel_19163.t1 / gene=Cvel_19163 / organism=Chromera_velia_CCMP2878 / gene_product=N-acetyltransferase 10 homolog, putative / transcript_product=N-acetyltransferase 10 homolog, putative / location=Cvel_scaffold1632:26891-36237(-) / protein_length=1199 / sequence_SO=supercontig / SO=protein_coding / is_pseudo=false